LLEKSTRPRCGIAGDEIVRQVQPLEKAHVRHLRRDGAIEQVVREVEVREVDEAGDVGRDRARDSVILEVELPESARELPGKRRQPPAEVVPGELEFLQASAVPQGAEEGVEVGVAAVAGQVVVREVEVLEPRQPVEHLRRQLAGEVVGLEVDPLEHGGVRQRRRDRAGQVVRPEEDEPEAGEAAAGGVGNVAGEGVVGEV
jgi:hypothetical protein